MANYLTSGDLMDRLSIKRSTFYKLIREHQFPKSVLIGKSRRWYEPQVQKWIESRGAK